LTENRGLTRLLLLLFLSGCAAPPDPANTVSLAGSETMVILVRHWAGIRMKANPVVGIRVSGGGTDAGIAALTAGETGIAMASRPLTREEKAAIKARRGAEAVEKAVALDAIAVWVNEKSGLKQMTLDQLRLVFTGKMTDWKRVGETPGPITAFGPPAGSGTRYWFRKRVLRRADFPPQVRTLKGSGVVADAVATDERAIGYGAVGYAPGTRALKISAGPGKPAVEPSAEEIAGRRYPLTRELYLYTAGKPSRAEADFIAFALSDAGQEACRNTGYVPIRPAIQAK